MNRHTSISGRWLLLTHAIAILGLNGCANPATKADAGDPWHVWNKATQSFNDGLDKHVVKPVAQAYLDTTNSAVDQGVSNFFSNIKDLGVTVNDLFQLKFLNGGMDLSRFVINSTVGVGGIFDVASQIDLPKHNEDFGQTLGFWGVPSGPYWVLPIFGPSTPRDTLGLIGDALLNPLTYVSVFGGFAGSASTAGAGVVNAADKRASLIPAEKVINEGAVGDRYDFIKNSYLQNREYLIKDGKTADEDDPLGSSDIDSSDGNNVSGTAVAPAKGKKATVELLPIQPQ